MAELAEILDRLRNQHAEIGGLAADAIERLVASEAEARAALAQCMSLLGQRHGKEAAPDDDAAAAASGKHAEEAKARRL